MYVSPFALHAETPTGMRTYGSLQFVWCLLYVYRDAGQSEYEFEHAPRARYAPP